MAGSLQKRLSEIHHNLAENRCADPQGFRFRHVRTKLNPEVRIGPTWNLSGVPCFGQTLTGAEMRGTKVRQTFDTTNDDTIAAVEMP